MTDDDVRGLYRRLLQAWNDRDAEQFAALFAGDATMIGFDGSQVSGADVAAHLRPIFSDHPTARYVAKVREVREVGRRAALLRASAGMVAPGGAELNPKVNTVHTLLVEQRDGAVRVLLFQSTPAQYHGRPEAAERHTAELQELLSAAPESGSPVH